MKNSERGNATLSGLASSMTSAHVKINALSIALNALSGLAINLAIQGISWAVNELVVTLDEQNKKLDEAITAYESSEVELQNINNELKTTSERIDELKGKDNLTFTEQDELKKLLKTNDELERKIFLLEKANAETEKEVANEAENTYDKYINNRTMGAVEQIDFYADSSLLKGVHWDDYKDDLPWLIAQYQNQQERLKNAQANGWTNIVEQTKKDLTLLEGYMSEASVDYQSLYDKISNISDVSMTPKLKTAKEDLNNILGIVANILGYGKQQPKNTFDDIWNSEEFSSSKTELENLAKAGKLDAETLSTNKEYKRLLDETGKTAEETAQHINALVEEEKVSSNNYEDSRTKMISSINSMSDGFETLNKISSSMKDNEPFDFTLLNDDKFKETFSGLGDVYTDFIKTITDNSDDFDACQSAFNNLATEWINSTGILDNVTTENEKLTASMLKQMGVANADELAHYGLEKAKAKEYLQSKGYSKITSNNIKSILDEANSAGYLTNEFINLVAQEIIFNNNGLNVSQKLEALRALAQQAGLTGTALASILNAPYEKDAATQKAWAEQHGFHVEAKKNKDGSIKYVTNSKDKKVEDWIWTKDGVTYENANEAALAIAGTAFSDALSTNIQANYPGANKGGGGSSATPETKETFNWIETALSRIQRTITNLGKTVSATWKSWADRNKALKDQVSAVTQEISLQEQAYNRYMALANGVGLSADYRSLVENGAIDISTITDENLAEKIKLYKEYYEAALDAYDAKIDRENELANLVQTEFDNTAKKYDDELSMHEHQSKMLQSSADILETKGYMVGAGIYDALARQEEEKITTLQNKYASLEAVLNSSNIPKYSEQWYEMQLQLAGVAEEIKNSQKNLAEYNNTLQEIDWNLFDKLQEKISGVTEESDFLIELMSDKKMYNDDGSITEHGQATLGLHAVKYNTYMAQADEYATELEQIRAELANDPYNQTLIDKEKELVEKQQDLILAAQKEKQTIKDLKSAGYDTLLDSMSSIIDKRKEMFSQVKDLHDYEKSIAEQTAEVTKYQKLIDSMQGMADTEEGRATLQKYEVSLKEAKENLEETEYDRYIRDQEQILDSLYDEAEEWVNSRLDNLDGLMSEVIESTNLNAAEIKTTLENESEEVGTTLSTEMKGLWSTNGEFTSVVSSYGGQQLTTLQEILYTMKEYFASMQKDAEEKAKEEIASSSASTPQPAPAAAPQTAPANTSSGNASWGSWFISKKDSNPKSRLNTETSIVDRLKYRDIDASFDAREKYYYAMGGSGVFTGTAQQNRWMLTQMKAHGFSDGGRIGPLIKASGEDGFILAKTGEEILSLEKIRALGESFAMMNPVVNSLLRLPAATDMDAFQTDRMVHIDIGDIQMYGVNDPEAFALQLKENLLNNGSIRKIMKDTTIGEALGKNSMTRYTR